MDRIKLSGSLSLPRYVHGLWRLADWKLSDKELNHLIGACMDMGINAFDHADIYGKYTCEALFGSAMKHYSGHRKDMQFITKCGIKLLSDKFPNTTSKHYDMSYEHIMLSVHNSLKNLRTDYIDLLLIHRPSPFLNPNEVAHAFNELKKSGKVLHFGASNFTPLQFEALSTYCDEKLVTNQIEISPFCLDHFENGNMDYLLSKKTIPMAWSPLAGGKLFHPNDSKAKRIVDVLEKLNKELNLDGIDQTAMCWLNSHPANIISVLGSGNINHLQRLTAAKDCRMDAQQWLQVYTASKGENLP